MPGQGKKKAVLFDVDDTLYDQTVPFMEAYAEYFGEDPAIPAEVIYPVTRKYSDQMFSRAMSGGMTMDEMYIYRVQKAFEDFGISISDEKALAFQRLYAHRQSYIRMSPLMEEILGYCSGKTKLGIITNGPSGRQWDKVKSLRAERWISRENIFVSADVGCEKPDRRIFDHAKQAMGLNDAEIWFVGDAYLLDVEGALNAGWNAVWMNRRNRKTSDRIKADIQGMACAVNKKESETGRLICVKTEEELFGIIRNLLPAAE